MIFATCELVCKIRLTNSLLTLIQFFHKCKNALVLRIIGRILSSVVELFFSSHSFYLDTWARTSWVPCVSVQNLLHYMLTGWKIHIKGMCSLLGLKNHIKWKSIWIFAHLLYSHTNVSLSSIHTSPKHSNSLFQLSFYPSWLPIVSFLLFPTLW